ncbi:hypothetical protein [Wolbachia endosymbiont of Spodoptera picta]|uniref:hypothetical protein n=1 Tax=Wolbachia endosymbiont of Spodoptera picta TaxID=2769078 RepID=UPI001FE44D2A|nr:hypothetical protein [Wolbachia endosymbiont of Spodoptera picta]
MLTFALDEVRYTYNWLIKKSRSTALDFIALFNKEYADSKRIGYIIEDHLVKKDLINIEPELEIKYELKRDLMNIEPKFKIKYDPYITKIDSSKMFKVMEQEHRSIANLKNVIRVRIGDQIRSGVSRFSYSYDGKDPYFYASVQASKIREITKDNTDLVLLLWLMYIHVPIDEHEKLLEDLVKNHSGNRVEMIEKLYLLQQEGKLSITNRESLDRIIKISPLIEKEYISNGKFSVMGMISSGNVDGLTQRLTKDTEGRVKELTGIDIQYSPESSLKNLSISAVIENYGLFK